MRCLRASVLVVCSAGALIAQSPRPITRTQEITGPARPVQLTEEMRVEGDGTDLLLTYIQALLPRADGSVWVIENSKFSGSTYTVGGGVPPIGTSRVIRVHGTTQAPRFTNVGRSGNGPGEWQMPAGLTALPDGRVLLYDNSIPNRITFYKADGALDTVWTLPGRVATVRVDTAGLLWVVGPPVVTRTATGADYAPVGPRILDRGGRDIGAALAAPRFAPSRPPAPTIGSGNLQTRLIAPYLGSNTSTWSPFGEYVGVFGDSGHIVRYPMVRRSGASSEGWTFSDSVVRYVRRGTRVPVSEAERTEQRARLQEVARLAKVRSARIPEIPSVKPHFTGGGRFDHDGRLWVQVAAPSVRLPDEVFADKKIVYPSDVPNRWTEPEVFEVFNRDMRLLGRVSLPPRAVFGNQLMPAKGDFLWVVFPDEDDIPTLIRYRLRWPSP